MKKINNKGFTLIELLAVITILGILMMVAIPNVSRTIENSRRDTFADVGQSYINAVRNAVLADELQCCNKATCAATDWINVAAGPTGDSGTDYYFNIDTAGATWKQQTEDLMESGGKSSWGNADVKGYVRFTKTPVERNGVKETKTTYYVQLADTAGHGIKDETQDQKIKRTSVVTTGAEQNNKEYSTSYYICKLA